MKTKMLKRDWAGRKVRLNVDIKNGGGGVFVAGTVMDVVQNYGGLELKREEHCDKCKGRGWLSISKVPEYDVTLLERADAAEDGLGTCNGHAHCFFGNDEKCCCGQTNRRQKVEAERDSLKEQLAQSLAECAVLRGALDRIGTEDAASHTDFLIAKEALSASSGEALAAVREVVRCFMNSARAYNLERAQKSIAELKRVFGDK